MEPSCYDPHLERLFSMAMRILSCDRTKDTLAMDQLCQRQKMIEGKKEITIFLNEDY